MGDLAPASSRSVVWKSTQYMNPTQAHPSILFIVAVAMRIGNATATATATATRKLSGCPARRWRECIVPRTSGMPSIYIYI